MSCRQPRTSPVCWSASRRRLSWLLFINRRTKSLNKGILNALQGLSPVVCREIEHQVGRGQELFTRDLTQEQRERLRVLFGAAVYYGPGYGGRAYMVTKIKGKPQDGVFLLNIVQYGTLASVSRWEDFSSLLDEFYEERDRQDRTWVKAQTSCGCWLMRRNASAERSTCKGESLPEVTGTSAGLRRFDQR